MNTKHCPECQQFLTKATCSCGWAPQPRPDYRCHYRLGKRRCVRAGEISPSPRSHAWYCIDHWRALNDPERGKQVLLEGALAQSKKNHHLS